MTRSMTFILLLLTPIEFCDGQPRQGVIAGLAQEWSGNASPSCERRSTGDQDVATPVSPLDCVWRADSSDRVTGSLDVPEQVSMVMWERTLPDSGHIFLDSIGTALADRGLQRHECGESSVPAGQARHLLWVGPRLAAGLVVITPVEGHARIMLFAMDHPEQLPEPFAACRREAGPEDL